ncbi:membrane protein [Sulfurifustis variabilis]|uniref:Outer membrane protein assembly factor BamE n=1 Tax=Sulfurifustis variabilis TaxID=1675686 RepID=A0A1B4V6E1_9GAMM|nr:outer membrane protein assembly factor BamE [Sulfurifustis variabilis]BAU48995.1 membrane protein [Sulfurifustis variabilis]
MLRSLGLAAVLGTGLLAGCIGVYKTDIQQGNVVTPDMVEKLKTGMTRSQVRFVLGTPLVTDTFHPDRWDYVFYQKRGADAPFEPSQFTVIFQGDALLRVEGAPTDDIAPPAAAPSGVLTRDEPGGTGAGARLNGVSTANDPLAPGALP